MKPRPPDDPLSPRLRESFERELRRAFGLAFPATRAYALDVGVPRAAFAVGERSPEDLLVRLMRDDPAALDALAAELTVGETYFFRHPTHFAFLGDVLRSLEARRPGASIRLWSAGCSTGEEAYSMAITALEVLGPSACASVEILATDVNPAALDRARAAMYGEWSFRDVPRAVKTRWFEPVGALFRLASGPRAMVRFSPLNLLEDRAASGLQAWPCEVDVIFCRNVLIYFDPAAVTRVTASLAAALSAGGFIVPGPSDPLLRSPLLIVETTEGIITCRRAASAPASSAPASSAPACAPLALPVSPPAAPRPAKASTARPPPRVEPEAAPALLEQARRLADRQDTTAALELLDGLIDRDPLQTDAYLLRAVVLQSVRDHARAAADADRAILLDRSSAYAHLLAAVSRARLDDRIAALRHLRNAKNLLFALDAAAAAPGAGGATVAELLAACQGLLRALAKSRFATLRRAPD